MYIAFEGIDGTGKTTQINLLKKAGLKKTKFVREPYYFDDAMRHLLLNKEYENPVTHSMLFLAAHAEFVTKILHKTNKKHIISDRSIYSSLAYSYGYNGNLMEKVKNTFRMFNMDTYPSLTFYFVGSSNKKTKDDAIERLPSQYFDRVRNCYEQLFQENMNTWIKIDANQPVEIIHKQILKILKHYGVA